MKRKPVLNFFDISSDLEELPENELFKLKGGDSDVAWEVEGDIIDVYPPGKEPEEPEYPEPEEPEEPWDTDDDDENIPDEEEGDSGLEVTGPEIIVDYPVSDDIWVKDGNGNIKATKTNRTNTAQIGNDLLFFDVYTIKSKDGLEVSAFKLTKILNTTSNEWTKENFDPKYESNCFGRTLTGGDYWMGIDDKSTDGVDEIKDIKDILNTLFEPSSAGDADIVVLEHGDPYHMGTINEDGTITAKDGTDEENTYQNLEDFRGDSHMDGTAQYYKMK